VLKHKGKVLEGVVVSDKMKNTIVVLVTTKLRHLRYLRLIITRKKYKAHDPENKAKVGMRVRIGECRPYSKDKRFRLLEIIK
jgi:small subunit ribosomal protein S17